MLYFVFDNRLSPSDFRFMVKHAHGHMSNMDMSSASVVKCTDTANNSCINESRQGAHCLFSSCVFKLHFYAKPV